MVLLQKGLPCPDADPYKPVQARTDPYEPFGPGPALTSPDRPARASGPDNCSSSM